MGAAPRVTALRGVLCRRTVGGVTNEQRLRNLYDSFNAREIDAVLAAMAEDVDWPNAWEGGRIRGREAVRSYWTRQWAELDPRVEPVTITTRADGRIAVDAHQVVRNLNGEVISEGRVLHVYQLRNEFIAGMDVEGHGTTH